MTAPQELVHALFQHAWGGSLTALAKRTQLPLELPDKLLVDSRSAIASATDHEDAMLHALLRWLWERNQFQTLDEDAEAELAELVERTLSQLAAGEAVVPTLTAHRDELAAFVRSRFGDTPREVVCSEYSPELQLQILGLRLETLAAPVLDIGCGPSAALVQFLREKGIQTQGLDRAVPSALGITADWLTFAYEAERPATALSHLGFSLHFLHQHLAGSDAAFAYARAYMNVLRSLRPLGRFVYTPGLPFIEDMLDTHVYRVQRVAFASELRVASLRQIEASTGLSLSHSTHVERVS